MKIGIDGFNLGLRQGTGIATYARELAKLLVANDHEVSTLYGIGKVPYRADLAWPTFIQQLVTVGESSRSQFRRWAPQAAGFAFKHLLNWPLQASEIKIRPEVDASAVADKLSAGKHFFNIPAIYRASQAISYVSARPLRVRLPPSVDVDLFHFTCPLPIKVLGVPNVVTAHDIIPLVLPQSTAVDLRHYRRLTQTSLKNADLILAASEHSRKDILSSFDIPEDKIVTIHQAVDIPKRFLDLSPNEVSHFLSRNYGLECGKYVMFYGALEPKKNIGRILDAVATARSDLSLVVVGRTGWLNEDVELRLKQRSESQRWGRLADKTSEGGKVHHFDFAPFRDLMFMLKGARALVFPSLYEGFGLPVLEAMVMGCPVITARVSSLPEVGGEAVFYVDPLNINEIAAAIDELADNDELHSSLIVRGLGQAKKFSPAVHMSKLEKAYQRVL